MKEKQFLVKIEAVLTPQQSDICCEIQTRVMIYSRHCRVQLRESKSRQTDTEHSCTLRRVKTRSEKHKAIIFSIGRRVHSKNLSKADTNVVQVVHFRQFLMYTNFQSGNFSDGYANPRHYQPRDWLSHLNLKHYSSGKHHNTLPRPRF